MEKIEGTLTLRFLGVIASKKNSKKIITNPRTGRPLIISSDQARKTAQEMEAQLRAQLTEKQRMLRYTTTKPLRKAEAVQSGKYYAVDVEIYEKDHRRRDLDNQITTILDALVDADILPDDSADVVKRLSVRNAGIDKTNPRAIIKITVYTVK